MLISSLDSNCSNNAHCEVRLANTEGKEVFMLTILVTIDGVGLLQRLVVILNLGRSSSFSSFLIRIFSLGGFSMYVGNLPSVENSLPFLGGFEGLKGLSCSASANTLASVGLAFMSSFRS